MADFIDKAKHKAEELTGKAKENTGKATDNRDLEAEGKGDQTSGGLKQAGDKAGDAVDDVKRAFKND
ncbi:CsbD family protein [Rhodococcus chondri]|uniref:CsbD family protein n=1 Tax=Rhodococcus chondri TaxID=3065941 RepID=A0ABU7JPE3_9NOCA|nr:CsbD family protein [Rhodococcus sp. CC-R104]MEE2031893.1 CsbD family protein [Rhodococcus sp. CC-R104]